MWLPFLWKILASAVFLLIWTAWRSVDALRSERAFDKVTHQHALSQIAQRAPLPESGLVALCRLTDQSELAHVARKAKAWSIRKKAIEKLDPRQHQSLLEDLVANDPHPDVRNAAREKLAELRNRRV